MNANIERKTTLLLNELKNSKLSVDDKLDMETMLTKAAETTNGTKDKIQGISEVLFSLVAMQISRALDGASGKWNTLCKMVVECKWAIVVLVGIVVAGSIFQPQLCALLAKLVALL